MVHILGDSSRTRLTAPWSLSAQSAGARSSSGSGKRCSRQWPVGVLRSLMAWGSCETIGGERASECETLALGSLAQPGAKAQFETWEASLSSLFSHFRVLWLSQCQRNCTLAFLLIVWSPLLECLGGVRCDFFLIDLWSWIGLAHGNLAGWGWLSSLGKAYHTPSCSCSLRSFRGPCPLTLGRSQGSNVS